ncbi:MAG: hypothetical protein QOK15_3548 [Nocardioidaceae bacterium]|nr:hypothetical protein [Nocardioidaceae bacterium]
MRTHAVNVTHLVFGLAFLGLAGCWALTEAGVVDARASWLLPLVLVVAGAVGLVAALARGINGAPAEYLPVDAWDTDAGTSGDTFEPADTAGPEATDGEDPEDGEPTRVL